MKKRKRDSDYVIYLKKKEAGLKTKDISDVESKQIHRITNDNITEVKSKPYTEPTDVNLIDMIKNTVLEERVRDREYIVFFLITPLRVCLFLTCVLRAGLLERRNY